MSERQHYSNEDAEAILRMAAEADSIETVSRDRLISMASELGISSDAVAAAEQKFVQEKAELAAKTEREQAEKVERRLHVLSIASRIAIAAAIVLVLGFSHFRFPWLFIFIPLFVLRSGRLRRRFRARGY